MADEEDELPGPMPPDSGYYGKDEDPEEPELPGPVPPGYHQELEKKLDEILPGPVPPDSGLRDLYYCLYPPAIELILRADREIVANPIGSLRHVNAGIILMHLLDRIDIGSPAIRALCKDHVRALARKGPGPPIWNLLIWTRIEYQKVMEEMAFGPKENQQKWDKLKALHNLAAELVKRLGLTTKSRRELEDLAEKHGYLCRSERMEINLMLSIGEGDRLTRYEDVMDVPAVKDRVANAIGLMKGKPNNIPMPDAADWYVAVSRDQEDAPRYYPDYEELGLPLDELDPIQRLRNPEKKELSPFAVLFLKRREEQRERNRQRRREWYARNKKHKKAQSYLLQRAESV